jgi:hypothetical protein
MSASWVVPAIAAHSRRGRAGTWIGAQGPSRSQIYSFIQVGTNEERDPAPDGPVRDFYYAFWSSTSQGFRPTSLFDVRPGDRIHAELSLRARRWLVSIHDLTSHMTVEFRTRQEANASFNFGEYLQEDVTDRRLHRPFPYPAIAGTRFSGLAVNGYPPRRSALQSQWMSTVGGDLGPGLFKADSFTVKRVTPTRFGLQYQKIAALEDAASTRFFRALVGWKKLTGPERRTESLAFAYALTHFGSDLARLTWPSSVVRKLILKLAAADRATRAVVLTAPRIPAHRFGAWTLRFARAAGPIGAIADHIRQILGLPQLTPQRY